MLQNHILQCSFPTNFIFRRYWNLEDELVSASCWWPIELNVEVWDKSIIHFRRALGNTWFQLYWGLIFQYHEFSWWIYMLIWNCISFTSFINKSAEFCQTHKADYFDLPVVQHISTCLMKNWTMRSLPKAYLVS